MGARPPRIDSAFAGWCAVHMHTMRFGEDRDARGACWSSGETRGVAPMCIGRLAECDLNCSKATSMVSHAMTCNRAMICHVMNCYRAMIPHVMSRHVIVP